jgi:hypothetical protein
MISRLRYGRNVSRRLGAIAVVSALVIATSGCSLFYGKGRPHAGNPPTQYVHCTNVYGPIVIDGLMATLFSISAVAAVQNSTSTDSMDTNNGAYTLFIVPGLFALSGIYGLVHVNDCSKHHEAWARLHPESPNGPVTTTPIYPPQPYPPQQYPPQQYPPQQYPPQQYPPQQYPPQAVPPQGVPPQGVPPATQPQTIPQPSTTQQPPLGTTAQPPKSTPKAPPSKPQQPQSSPKPQ